MDPSPPLRPGTTSINHNIVYSVWQSQKLLSQIPEEIAHFIHTNYPHQSGLIFCLSRADCESISAQLASTGLSVTFYHATLPFETRNERRKSWEDGEVDICVATQAFEPTPLTKLDVRFVIHSSLPLTLEKYYSATQRAGLDGKKADCLLVYRRQDTLRLLTLLSMTREGRDWKEERKALHDVVKYCENLVDCRLELKKEYFIIQGEEEEKDEKGGEEEEGERVCCDNCSRLEMYEFRNVSEEAQSVMQMMMVLLKDSKDFGVNSIAKSWRGGVGKRWGFTNEEAIRLVHYLLIEGHVEQEVQGGKRGFIRVTQSQYDQFVSSQPTILIPFLKKFVNIKRAR